MTTGEINYCLGLFGFSPLREEDPDEALLTELLDAWENSHPLQRRFKDTYIFAEKGSRVDLKEDEFAPLQEELLFLREEMRSGFMKRDKKFPYMNK